MSLNWKEIDLVISELDIHDAIIQNVVQLDFHSLYFELFKNDSSQWLYVCLQARMTRIHLSAPPRRTKGIQPRFCEFLRARLLGAKIVQFKQFGQERIVAMETVAEAGPMIIYIRLWSNAANILAVDQAGVILDAFYRRPQKAEISNKPFVMPEIKTFKPGNTQDRFFIRDWPRDYPGGFNAFLESSYSETSREQSFQGLKEKLQRQCQAQLTRFKGRQSILLRQIQQAANPERFKQMGEIILSFKHQISRGQTHFETDDWYSPGNKLTIDLEASLEPGPNAERYFQKFQKARDGATYIKNDLAQVESAITLLETIQADVDTAAEIRPLELLAEKLGFVEDSNRKTSTNDSNRPGLSFFSHNFMILIGRSAQENDDLLRRHVRGNDYWLHVRDVQGGYVFIKVPRTKTVPLEVLLDAAHLAVWYSRAKGEPEVDLFYTQVKYLRRAKHGTYGMVVPTRERNLHVSIDPKRVAELQNALNGPSG